MDDHTFALMQEPGSVEEMQHVVAECFGSNCYGSERLWNLFQTAISDAMTDFSGGLKDHTERTIDEEKVNNKFPSLDLSLLNGNCGAIRSFEFNSEEPIPIENDWFSGLIQINLNPPSERDASVKTEHENRVSRFRWLVVCVLLYLFATCSHFFRHLLLILSLSLV